MTPPSFVFVEGKMQKVFSVTAADGASHNVLYPVTFGPITPAYQTTREGLLKILLHLTWMYGKANMSW